MNIFLFTYNDKRNYDISKEEGIVGCKDAGDGLRTKFMKLELGDLIVIRDSRSKELKFFGYGQVTSKPYYQRNNSPQNYLWEDEKEQEKVIYPNRVKTDFFNIPSLKNLFKIDWNDLLRIQLKNQKGNVMEKEGLGKFMNGNFLKVEYSGKFANLVGLEKT